MTLNEEKILRGAIRQMVKESIDEMFNEMYNEDLFEKKRKEKEDKPKHRKKTKFRKAGFEDGNKPKKSSNDRDGKPGRESDASLGRLKSRRSTVMDMLKNKHVDCAPYSYELWPDKKKDNARSQFYKCRDGEENDNGNHYSFTDSEINRLFSILTNNQG